MDDKRKNRYQDKIANLTKYYNLLSKWIEKSDLKKMVNESNYKEIFSIYHAAQLSIEVISDICVMMVKDSQLIPKDNYTNFETLYSEGILSNELLDALKELNGLRNRIVHDYNGIIDKIAVESIINNLPKMKSFQEVVKSWLKEKL